MRAAWVYSTAGGSGRKRVIWPLSRTLVAARGLRDRGYAATCGTRDSGTQRPVTEGKMSQLSSFGESNLYPSRNCSAVANDHADGKRRSKTAPIVHSRSQLMRCNSSGLPWASDVRQYRIGLIVASRGCSRCDAKRGS